MEILGVLIDDENPPLNHTRVSDGNSCSENFHVLEADDTSGQCQTSTLSTYSLGKHSHEGMNRNFLRMCCMTGRGITTLT